jgi:hypothetical protein
MASPIQPYIAKSLDLQGRSGHEEIIARRSGLRNAYALVRPT